MTKRFLVVLFLLATPVLAQVDPLRNVSGTAPNPGSEVPWLWSQTGGWTYFYGLTAHATYVTEYGPDVDRSEVFSTNWIGAGVHRSFGDRAFALVRGRVSLEPFTIPDEDGYPQMLQYVSTESGGPLIDRMRPHDLIGEAALHAGFRPTASTLLHVYAAAVGDPALGPPPFALRSSAVDFAEAPFAYDIQEPFHDSTRVVTAGFSSRWLSMEASKFHDAVTFGDHTEIDDGDFDSTSYRLTLTPTPNLSVQASRGKLGGDVNERDISSASISYGGELVAATALWTRRERDGAPSETAYGVEIAVHSTRNTFMGRAEWVDRPLGFPVSGPAGPLAFEQTTHFAVGYIFDFLSSNRLRAGAGVNIDYHTQSHELPPEYGHKPQAIYLFARVKLGRF